MDATDISLRGESSDNIKVNHCIASRMLGGRFRYFFLLGKEKGESKAPGEEVVFLIEKSHERGVSQERGGGGDRRVGEGVCGATPRNAWDRRGDNLGDKTRERASFEGYSMATVQRCTETNSPF